MVKARDSDAEAIAVGVASGHGMGEVQPAKGHPRPFLLHGPNFDFLPPRSWGIAFIAWQSFVFIYCYFHHTTNQSFASSSLLLLLLVLLLIPSSLGV